MSSELIQVRDVPAEDVEALRTRAANRRMSFDRPMSLSSYLRELIHDHVSRPAMSDVLARIAARDSVEADSDAIRSVIDDGHRE